MVGISRADTEAVARLRRGAGTGGTVPEGWPETRRGAATGGTVPAGQGAGDGETGAPAFAKHGSSSINDGAAGRSPVPFSLPTGDGGGGVPVVRA